MIQMNQFSSCKGNSHLYNRHLGTGQESSE